MPFKIVQTIEEGEIRLTTVPEQWEHNGILYWPEKREVKLRKKESSVANYEAWSKINCMVKRRNIPTFYQAEEQIDAMSDASETETDTENQPPNKIKRLPQKTFNHMAEAALTSSISSPLTKTQSKDRNQFISQRKRPINPDEMISIKFGELVKLLILNKAASSSSISLPLTKTQSEDHNQFIAPRNSLINPDELNINQDALEANDLPMIHINETDLFIEPVILQEAYKENVGTDVNLGKIQEEIKSIKEDIETVKNNIETVKNNVETLKNNMETVTENQSILANNQNTIIAQNSELSIKLEEFIKVSLSTKNNTNLHESGIKKIFNMENLEEFERKLDQPDSRDEVYRQHSVILSSGIGKGTTNAYTLVDAMFDRKFFTQCSWTGGSKGDTTKICFKGLTKTINFFFTIVHESDKTFTKAQLIKFFKTILRNARYRSQNEQVRMSGQRKKQKNKLKPKKSLATALPDNLENLFSNQDQRELPDLESETSQSRSEPLLQENQQTNSSNSDDN